MGGYAAARRRRPLGVALGGVGAVLLVIAVAARDWDFVNVPFVLLAVAVELRLGKRYRPLSGALLGAGLVAYAVAEASEGSWGWAALAAIPAAGCGLALLGEVWQRRRGGADRKAP